MKNKNFGIAVDIGTTTVVAHLVNIDTGEISASLSEINAQRKYGADVITRIKYCGKNGHDKLTSLIREQIISMISELCDGICNFVDIKGVSLAGNTIMQHIAAGYSPVSMGAVPFSTISLFGDKFDTWNGLNVNQIYYAPCISAYVGGDITAGVLAAGFDGHIEEPATFLDIGTNGEIVLKYNGTYYCCATAAGPAFEGAGITMGMAAVNGAIDHVSLDPIDSSKLNFTTIGNDESKGLCGSGLVDALAVMLALEVVDESGRLEKEQFYISENVFITAKDVRNIQLAKAAIAAGIQTLLTHVGLREDDIKTFVLAGGFGSFMDKVNAAKIGLFPKTFLPVTAVMGNTSGEGAILALCSPEAQEKLDDVREKSEYIELSTSTIWNEQFIEQMMFEV